MTRVLITGAAGFCARHLVALLSAEGNYRVVGLDVAANPPADLPIHEYCRADVSNREEMAKTIAAFQPDMIFHLAGASGGSSSAAHQDTPLSVFLVNAMGAMHVLEAVRLHAPGCRVLLAGSAAEYGYVPESELPVSETRVCCPVGAYGISKLAATCAGQEYARKFGLKVVIARPFNIVGPGMPGSLVIGALADRAKRALASSDEAVVKAGDLSSERDFVAVEDVVRSYVQLLKGEFWGEVFNLCSGQPRPVQEAADILFSHSPRRITLKTEPSLAGSGVRSMFGSFEKAKRAIGYRPTISLECALAAVWNTAMAA